MRESGGNNEKETGEKEKKREREVRDWKINTTRREKRVEKKEKMKSKSEKRDREKERQKDGEWERSEWKRNLVKERERD